MVRPVMMIVAQEYIEVDDRGVAKVIGTRSKVRQIVMDAMNGWSPEKIHDEYPHLSLSQIHAALAYYHEHRVQIDEEIESDRRWVEEMRANHVPKLTRAQLEARWRAKYGTESPTVPSEIL
jgi:uncharacterized protein (DUF433 family)